MTDTTDPATAPPAPACYPELRGRTVLITGGAAGLGRGMARAFGHQGARLFLLDIDAESLACTAEALRADGITVATQVGSVTDPTAVDGAFDAAVTRYGTIAVLLNNAGIAMNKPTLALSLADWQRTLDVNLTGAFLCAKAAAQRMAGGGVIVNMASMYGQVAAPERLAYCVTKSGVAMMTKALAIEWADRGIRVNGLAPGYVETALVADLIAGGRLDKESLKRRTPLGRLGTEDEVADCALFLASDRARFITGQIVGIDGGWTAYGYV